MKRKSSENMWEQLLLPLQSPQQKANQYARLFTPEVQELLLTRQKITLSDELMREPEQLVVSGLVPFLVDEVSITRSSCRKGRREGGTLKLLLHNNYCAGCAIRKLPHMSLAQQAGLYVLERAIQSSCHYLETLQDVVLQLMQQVRFPESMEKKIRQDAILFHEHRLDEAVAYGDTEETLEEMINRTTARWRFMSFHPFMTSEPVDILCCYKAHPKQDECMRWCNVDQYLPRSPSTSLLSPLSLSSATQCVPDSSMVMLIKIHVVLYRDREPKYNPYGLQVTVAPLTAYEHNMLYLQPRLDGELPCVLPYGCILCSDKHHEWLPNRE